MEIVLICMSSFFTAFFLFWVWEHRFFRAQRKVRLRMKGLKNLQNQKEDSEREAGKIVFTGAQKTIAFVGKVLERRGIIKPLEAKMIKADLPLRGEEYLVLWLLVIFVPGFLLFFVTRYFIGAVVLGFLGLLIPPLLVSKAQQKKLKRFNQQLIDALSIISSSLRAGHSFMQALELVSKEMPNPLGKEFSRTFHEIKLGTTIEEALHNLGQRVASDDLELMITAVLIQRQIGGNLAEIMDNIAHTIRDRIRIQGEIKTLTAQGRLSGVVIGLIPLFLAGIMLLLNPGYLRPLFCSSVGLMMLAAGIIGEIIGILCIKKIVSIDL
ncbi:MAG: type II secretion system F family protein [Clostridia bacterium]|nr:type II secretion system F family protein [Clostridia bacterium]MDD4666084.1 type II secretion system F family protein [Clostridia bacterium]